MAEKDVDWKKNYKDLDVSAQSFPQQARRVNNPVGVEVSCLGTVLQ